MKILNVTQGSPEWAVARCGVVTASEVDALITPLWKIRTGEGVETYLYRKLAEKLLGYPVDFGGTWAMDQGQLVEQMALPWFEFEHDMPVQRVGFVTSDDGKIGCSPDGLIGHDGGIEIKSPQPPAHLKYLMRGELPADYRAQVHFSMFVTGRPWWYFLSYSRQFPPLLLRIERDERIISAIRDATDSFLERFDESFAKIDAMRKTADKPKP